jgi:class 3 adenylate cyclase
MEQVKEVGKAGITPTETPPEAHDPADAVATAAASSTPAPAEASAERRQLTVMFCDLVGSTALSTQLDPEDLGRVIGDFRAACANAVAQFGGSVAKYMGDGALVYFGYPEAYEDAAARAILAGPRWPRRRSRGVRTAIFRSFASASQLNGGGGRIDRRRRSTGNGGR